MLFPCHLSLTEATDVSLVCRRSVQTSISRLRHTWLFSLTMTNKAKQHILHSNTCNQSEARGGLETAGITLTNKPCRSGTHHASINQ